MRSDDARFRKFGRGWYSWRTTSEKRKVWGRNVQEQDGEFVRDAPYRGDGVKARWRRRARKGSEGRDKGDVGRWGKGVPKFYEIKRT